MVSQETIDDIRRAEEDQRMESVRPEGLEKPINLEHALIIAFTWGITHIHIKPERRAHATIVAAHLAHDLKRLGYKR